MASPQLGHLRDFARSTRLHYKLRTRFLQRLRAAGALPNSVVILQGGDTSKYYDTDTDRVWFQESFFHYLFGIEEPGLSALLTVDSEEVHILIPRFSPDYGKWFPLPTPETISETYACSSHFIDELPSLLLQLQVAKVYLNQGTNSDSGTTPLASYFWHPCLADFTIDDSTVHPVLSDCRAVKIPEEVELMRVSCKVASEAHVKMMRECKQGLYEYNLAGVFQAHMAQFGYYWAYPPISASGHHGSILHYPSNSSVLEDGGLVLADMGCAAYGYMSDVTTTFPVNGQFTETQKALYETVLAASRAVLSASKPGVAWTDMHILADRHILVGLAELGIVKGDVDEMVAKRLGATFMPHGLGHLLGLDCHDVGGYGTPCCPPRLSEPGLSSLRTRRILESGMIITVEPGIYFIDYLLDQALNDDNLKEYLVAEQLNKFRGFGGIRIEEDVLITETGNEVLSDVPRTVSQIEAAMRGDDWKS